MCVYNHCIEDRQKNLAFIAETEQQCRIVTVKPLSHLAYIILANPGGEPSQFTEANKVLFSQMHYSLERENLTQVTGVIEFVKQISSVRHVTPEECDVSDSFLFPQKCDVTILFVAN